MAIFGKKKNLESQETKYKDDDGFLTEINREEKIQKDLGITIVDEKKKEAIKEVEESISKSDELDVEQSEKKEKSVSVESAPVKRDFLRGLFDRVKRSSVRAAEESRQKENADTLNESQTAKAEISVPEVQKSDMSENKISQTIAAELNSADRRIYTLNGLPPEVIAVAFAKCSRSPEPFDFIAKELNEDLSRKFHERWIVGYGHSSVAEHAVLSIAIENVSILATKVIEDNRLASFTEKSTRYQVFDKNRYYKPAKIMKSKHAGLFESTCNMLIDVYTEMYPKMLDFVKMKNSRTDDADEKLYEVRMKAKALDNARYILPVGVLTNLGMTVNARQLEHALKKLMSHNLDEMREIGAEIKESALKVTPTLVKYADYSEYLAKTPRQIHLFAENKLKILRTDDSERTALVEYDKDAEDKVIAALLYSNTHYSYRQIRDRIRLMKNEDKKQVIDLATEGMGKFDSAPREFEQIYYTFDILIDYGAFRDIQRHRLCTQINQEVTAAHGFVVPSEIADAKLDRQFADTMRKAKEAYDVIAQDFPDEAAYLVPMAYKKRVLMTMNLRELCHFIKLRSGKVGHVSYRRLAQQMWELINEKHPLIARYIEVDKS